MTIDVLELPFDQYQRYQLAADLLAEVRPRGARWSILDVGGRTALLRSFLPDARVTLVDLEPSGEPGLVLGNGAALPFADASFDAVTAFDTLEHVPPPVREAFVRECRRVARSYVAIVGPYEHPAVVEAERLLQLFLKAKLGVEHRYLEEHRHHGLPDRAAVERWLAESGAEVASIAHGNVERWLALLCASMYMDYTPELRGIAARFFRFYNEKMYRSDHAPPVYRHVVMAGIGGAPLPARGGSLEHAQAPPGGVKRITELAFELVEFERARTYWTKERAELLQMVAELQKDLAGHRAALADQKKVIEKVDAAMNATLAQMDRLRGAGEEARDLLVQNDQKITELRKELRNRWRNLGRALGPRRPIP